jgi:hypothetical protein
MDCNERAVCSLLSNYHLSACALVDHLADALVLVVRDVEVARAVHRHTSGIIEFCAGGRDVVPVVRGCSVARHGGDGAARIDLTDALVVVVPDVEVARAVHRHGSGIDFCAGGRDIVPIVPCCSVASHGGDSAARIDLADAPVGEVRDVEVARAVHRHASGIIEFCAGGRDVVPIVSGCSVARHGGDSAARIDLADALVALVRNVEVPRAVHRHGSGTIEFCTGSRDIIPIIPGCSVARYGGDGAARIDLADALVGEVRDVEVARAVHRHANKGMIEFCADGRDVVPIIPGCSVARHGGDSAARIDLADALVALVRDVEVPRAVHRHAKGTIEFCTGSRDIIPIVPGCSVARYGGDSAARIDLADALVGEVHDVEVPGAVHRHASGIIELCAGGGDICPHRTWLFRREQQVLPARPARQVRQARPARLVRMVLLARRATGLLFLNRRGRPLKRSYVVKFGLKPILKKLGMKTERVGLHAFRHGLGTALCGRKANPATVQRIQTRFGRSQRGLGEWISVSRRVEGNTSESGRSSTAGHSSS